MFLFLNRNYSLLIVSFKILTRVANCKETPVKVLVIQ